MKTLRLCNFDVQKIIYLFADENNKIFADEKNSAGSALKNNDILLKKSIRLFIFFSESLTTRRLRKVSLVFT